MLHLELRIRMPRKPVLVLEGLLATFVALSHSREAFLGKFASENHRENVTEILVY